MCGVSDPYQCECVCAVMSCEAGDQALAVAVSMMGRHVRWRSAVMHAFCDANRK